MIFVQEENRKLKIEVQDRKEEYGRPAGLLVLRVLYVSIPM